MSTYEAEVDPALCTGAQMCVSVAPDHFRYETEAGVSVATAMPRDGDAVLEAAELCPVEAIRVRDVRTGATVFP